MWKIIYPVAVVALGTGTLFYLSYGDDKKAAEEAVLQIVNAGAEDRADVELGYARARSKALTISSDKMRDRSLAEIKRIYDERHAELKKAEQLKA